MHRAGKCTSAAYNNYFAHFLNESNLKAPKNYIDQQIFFTAMDYNSNFSTISSHKIHPFQISSQ